MKLLLQVQMKRQILQKFMEAHNDRDMETIKALYLKTYDYLAFQMESVEGRTAHREALAILVR